MQPTTLTIDLRRALGMSQEKFARTLDVSLRTAQRWEGGDIPAPEMLARLRALAVESNQSALADGFQRMILERIGSPADMDLWDKLMPKELKDLTSEEAGLMAEALRVLRLDRKSEKGKQLLRLLKPKGDVKP